MSFLCSLFIIEYYIYENVWNYFKVIYDGEEQEETFSSYEDAEEYGVYLQGCERQGAEIMNMSNPGDYDYDEDSFESPDFEIVEED